MRSAALKVLTALVVTLGVSYQVQAGTISLTPDSTSLVLSGNESSQSDIDAIIDDDFGTEITCDLHS